MSLALLFITLLVLLIMGAPIAVALAGSSLLFVLIEGTPDIVVIHNMINGVNSFPLLAVPFFILTGGLMNTSGITNRIFDFAKAIVGWMHGGLGHVNIGASVIFAGMSGAAVADAGGLGSIEIKAMRDAGYDSDFSVGVTAASSTIGPIIPPSLPLVIFGVMASVSIGKLFVAGLVPGLLMAGALMLMVSYYARKRSYPRDARFSIQVLGSTFQRAILPLITPLIIIGGIVTGIFTPTEASIAAVFYALFLGGFVYRTLNWNSLAKVSMETVEVTASIMLIVAAASIFGWILTANQVADKFATSLLAFSDNKFVLMMIITFLVLLIGCFMETIAAITILVPVLMPISQQLGIEPVHLGIFMILNLMIGLLTPPVGMVLFVLSKVAKVPFEQSVKATIPFLIPLVTVLLMIMFIPQITLWLPNLLY